MSGSPIRVERVCTALTVVLCLAFAAAALWELGDSFGAGHFASAAAVCTGAENMWRWGVIAPVTHDLARPPMAADFYCHHPWGIFWVTALFMKGLGHHAWACRLPAVLQSGLTPPALYFGARALWGPVAGLVTAASFATLPIALSFSDFNSLEVPVLFGVALSVWGYARFRQGYARRFLGLSLAGLTYAVSCDWAAVVFAAGLLAAIFASMLATPAWGMGVDRRRVGVFFGLALTLCGLVIGLHLFTFMQLGQLNELFAQGNLRSAGASSPLSRVLEARKFWIEVSFTGLAIGIGKLALPVLSARVVLRRSELEALPLAVFAMATVQYVVFKQGADVHIFWPQYFALYFAFAAGGLTQSGLDLTQRALRALSGSYGSAASYTWGALGLLAPLAILPDGLRALRYAHRSGGRFNENGHLIKPDKDKVAALEWLTARMAPGSSVALHPGMRQSLWVDWSLQRPVTTVTRLPLRASDGPERYYVADQRFMSAAEQEALAKAFSLTLLGPFLAVDRTAHGAALSAFTIQRREPTTLEAYFVSSSHALRDVLPDPYLAWEMRDRFELSPNPSPNFEPRNFEELRVAHNIAIAAGDAARAQHWLSRLLSGCDRRHAQPFDDGNTLLGTRLERGASLVFSVYLQASGPDPLEPQLLLHSRVEAAPRFSLVARDETLADVGMPFAIPASRWKRGFVYASVTEIIRRLGDEHWDAAFRPAGAGRDVAEREILRLE